ncbi:hypothetical protein MML48_7g00020211 [Holotrichia oblita]|uniref:Uncharacterized protein n=1 Tax=Holotrichia oblita TaxID=644536 RepID=A0ACB9SUW8_HOLOL|nr:hypothetical protein MML48_7g00020211 [Holotrichia oblita]
MDAQPSASIAGRVHVCSPPKRREKASHLHSTKKQTLINAYKKIIADTPNLKKLDMIKQITDSILTGVSRITVYRVIKVCTAPGICVDPKKITGRPAFLKSFDETVKTAIWQIVHNMFRQNEPSTLDKVLVEVKNNEDLPNMSRSTLYLLMKQMNFK